MSRTYHAHRDDEYRRVRVLEARRRVRQVRQLKRAQGHRDYRTLRLIFTAGSQA